MMSHLYCTVGNLDNCTDGELRLISGQSSSEGTVQICAFGYWGTICRNSWDSREADVVCNQLGYPALGKVLISLNWLAIL